jgi:DNA-binding NarL/FixJ family response regulator
LANAPAVSLARAEDRSPASSRGLRIILAGPPAERAALRARLAENHTTGAAFRIVAEFGTLAAARASAIDGDAILTTRDARLSETGGFASQESLTPREIEVLELLAEGLPNKAIAVRLHISDQTVKFHVASISGKLGAANRTDAVRLAIRRGLITV